MAGPDELDALSANLRGAYESAWEAIRAEQAAIAAEPAKFTRQARLKELQAAVDDRLDFVDEAAAAWLADDFPVAYRLGAETAGGVLNQPFQWTTHDNEAVTLLAQDTFGELLEATDGVSASTKALIRELGRQQALLKAAAGRTATQAARELRRLLERKGIFSVRYKDGSKHGLADYTDMLLRTKTGVAHNSGLLNFGRRAGTKFYEVFDGVDCFTGRFHPYGELVGVARARYSGPMLTIRCGQDRVDVSAGAAHAIGDLRHRESLGVESHHLGVVDPPAMVASLAEHRLTVGPNHPVLARRGWICAHALEEGDEIAYDQRLEDPAVLAQANLIEVPMVEDVFGALAERFGTHVRPAGAQDLHGDGRSAQGEVEIVGPAGRLLVVGNARFIEPGGEPPLVRSDVRTPDVARGGAKVSLRRRMSAAALRFVRRLDDGLSFIGRAIRPLPLNAAATRAVGESATAPDGTGDRLAAGLALERDRLQWLTIHSVIVEHFEGYVFDATTSAGAFSADGFVVKNCGWLTHDDNDKANRSIRSAEECAKATLSHPRCRRSFGPRPDITTAEEAKNAKSSITDAQAADQAAAERARVADQRRRANTRRRQQTTKARKAAERQAKAAARAARQAERDARAARAGTQGDLDLDRLPLLSRPADLPGDVDGLTPAQIAAARKELPKLKAQVRNNAADVRSEAQFALDSADVFQMAPPYAKGSIEARQTGLYDWFYDLDADEQLRLRQNWMKGPRQTANPDLIAERIGNTYGAADYDTSIARWLDETRRYDAAGALQRGKLPASARYGDLDLDATFGDGTFKVADLFDTDADHAARSVAGTYQEQNEEFAARVFARPAGDRPAPYEMSESDYVDELTRLEGQAREAQPIRSDPDFGDEYSPEDEAVFTRLNELVPNGIEGAETLPANELHRVIVEHARAAGLV